MISAWDIYWVMQLDSICRFFFVVGVLAAVGGAVTLFIGTIEEEERVTSFARKVLVSGIASIGIASVLPSTKTAAAMLIIPAVANNETIQKEAGDLYRLAKQALQEAVDAPKEEAKE